MTQLVVRASDISRRRRAAKFTKTRKIPRNSVEILSNTCLYNIFETYFSYRGYLLAVNLQIYLGTSSLKRANNVPKLPGVDYVAKNWALAMMLKALPLVHFWSVLLLKEQMMTSVRKTLKTLVWSAQNRSISNEVFPEITTKSAFFDRLIFSWVCPENSCEIGRFFGEFAPKNPAKLDFFFRDLSEALHSMVRSIRFENIVDRSRYKFGGKLALFMRFGTFFMMKAKQDKMKCLF